jgi:hypothetical protein
MVSQKGRKLVMMIKMLLEEAGQYFYCEARRTASHEFEGIVHFLHKVGNGNAFVRGKTYHVKAHFESRNDALMAAELHGKHIAMQLAPSPTETEGHASFESSTPNAARISAPPMEKSAR